MKVLLWKLGALGDVLMTTPLVRQLRRALPQAYIQYLVGRSAEAVLAGNPHLDSVVTFDESILVDRQIWRLAELARMLRGFDRVFVLDKHWIFAVLAAAAGIPSRVGFSRRMLEGALHTHRVHYGPVRHEICYYLDLAAACGLPVDADDVRLEMPAAVAVDMQTPYAVMVNAGGNNANEQSAARRLPEPLFAELVKRVTAQGKRVVFLGSASEQGWYRPFETPMTRNLCGATSLAQARGIMERACDVYATDSGLMHVAAAAGARLTGVFGPTHPLRKCPPGARWVWADEEHYDARYELFGTPATGAYFRRLDADRILGHQRPGP